jgi:hypothetical protein
MENDLKEKAKKLVQDTKKSKKYTCEQWMKCLKKRRRKHKPHKKLQTIIIQVRP